MKRRSGDRSPSECSPATKRTGGAELLQRRATHTRHEAHVRDDVRTVRDLDADLRERRAERSHDVGNDVHGPSAHRAVEQRADLALRLAWLHPVVQRSGVVLLRRADEGEVLGARDVGRIGAMEVAVGESLGIEPVQRAGREHLAQQPVVLAVGAVDPVHAVRLAEPCALLHPGVQGAVRARGGRRGRGVRRRHGAGNLPGPGPRGQPLR